MAGQPISDLIVAAKNLTSVLYAGYEGTDKVKVGIVPFAGSVNVGAANQGVSWVDSGGLSPVHSENSAEQHTRFELFAELGVSWGGCVEVRPSSHDVTAACRAGACRPACSCRCSRPTSPTRPMPKGTATATTIRSDTGGRCVAPTPTCVHVSRRGRCTSWSTPALPAAEAQARTSKYDGGSVAAAPGPNALCDSRAILPLTEHKSAVKPSSRRCAPRAAPRHEGWRMLSAEESR